MTSIIRRLDSKANFVFKTVNRYTSVMRRNMLGDVLIIQELVQVHANPTYSIPDLSYLVGYFKTSRRVKYTGGAVSGG